MKVCKRYFVSGRVQGVFYRASAERKANQLGVKGWVRNRVDGRVEILADGEESQLDEFEKWLEIGPQYAKVTNIEIVNENLDEQTAAVPTHFEVRPTAS